MTHKEILKLVFEAKTPVVLLSQFNKMVHLKIECWMYQRIHKAAEEVAVLKVKES